MNALEQVFAERGTDRPLIAVVAGSGQIARCAVRAGADLLMVLNAGLYRNLGVGSLASFLPYGNANEQTTELLRSQVLPQAQGVPIVVGVFAADPEIDLAAHLGQLRDMGVAGVTNWPAISFLDGVYREALAEAGVETEAERDMLRQARRLGLTPLGFACTARDAVAFAPDSDGMILNVGLTRHVQDLSDRRDAVQQAITRLNRMLRALGSYADTHPCLAFGGPITTPEDFQPLMRQSRVAGFAGGSVFERIPVQEIVESTIRRFRGVFAGRGDGPDRPAMGDLVGHSPGMQHVLTMIRRIAPYDVSVCIEGESGSGKELVASQIHRLSPRAQESFVTLNCGAMPETLIESELFGHERGAFTGADRRRLGKFELAHRGTLFLDEVADLSPRAQVALLRAIQQREITRVGGEQPTGVDVRIVTASHQHLPARVQEGKFRADLYYRLNEVALRIPPLRERLEDMPALVESILSRLRIQLGRPLSGVSAGFYDKLLSYAWPGNVRELEHALCRAALLEDGPLLDGRSFDPQASPVLSAATTEITGSDSGLLRRGAGHAAARSALAQATVRRCGGNKSRAAAELGVSRKTLYAWLRS